MVAWGLSLWFVTPLPFRISITDIGWLECRCHKLCRHAETSPTPQEAEQGSLWKAGETSEQLVLEKMKSKSPIIAVRPTKEEKLLWVIPGCMNNEKKLSKGRVS